MKDPAFLFYPNDWLGGTMGMTFEQKGAYIDLLMLQFNRGHMTTHMIGQVLGQNGGQIWESIKEKFEEDEQGRYFNRRLEDEQNKRKAYTESRRNNIKGENQYTKPPKKQDDDSGHMDGHMTSHMENENRNEDIDKSKSKKCKNKTIEERETDFTQSVTSINKEQEILTDLQVAKFLNYWTERSGVKMRYEKERTFDAKRRMERWAMNQIDFNRGQAPEPPKPKLPEPEFMTMPPDEIKKWRDAK